MAHSPAATGPAISVDGLTRHYSSGTCVGPLTFDVPRGVVTGLVGPNGVGKTTTIRMLLGLIRPDGGRLNVLDATSWDDLPRVLNRVGAIVEGPAPVPTLSGRSNLLVLSRLAGWGDEVADGVLAQVGLADRAHDRVRDYSLGMRQRLTLAAALMGEPELLILDEPANGLDPQGVVDLRGLLSRIAARGTTVVVSSHVLSEIEQICEHLVVLSADGIAYHGSRRDLTERLHTRVLLQTADASDAPRLLEVLSSRGYVVERAVGEDGEAGGLTVLAAPDGGPGVSTAPGPSGAAINRLAIEAGVVLARIEPRRQSLEEVFFALTGSPQDTLGSAS